MPGGGGAAIGKGARGPTTLRVQCISMLSVTQDAPFVIAAYKDYFTYIFVFLGSIIIYGLYKMTLSD